MIVEKHSASNAPCTAAPSGCSDVALPSPEDAIMGASATLLIGSATPSESNAPAGNLLSHLRSSRVLFYPGAGEDISPALRFAGCGVVDTIVYCDYLASFDGGYPNIRETFEQYSRARLPDSSAGQPNRSGSGVSSHDPISWREISTRPINAQDLGLESRADLFSTDHKDFGSEVGDSVNPVIGLSAVFGNAENDGSRINFIYLNTEAIQTYLHLWGAVHLAPLIVVVQNHGLGGLWTPLDGDCLLFASAPVLPLFLYVGDINSQPWPGYKRISCTVSDPFSMHKSQRSLYECVQPGQANPDSPLKQWDGEAGQVKSRKYSGFEKFRLTNTSSMRHTAL